MGFLGLEKPIEYTGTLIFDPTMAKMVLDAQDKYFNVVYADYVRGLDEMKEFKKEYGDFLTPILADLEWYNLNVTGKIRNFIDLAYANGIDLTRSSEGRLAISKLINSIDTGSIAKLRSSAENAKEFLKARRQLEASGLYNPILAKYDGPDIDTYSTLDRYDENGNVIAGSGIWDKMSPTRITDMATFGNPYFEGMKPNVRKVNKNGAVYNIEAITEDDLKGIANSHFNELVSTPQGNLMYQYYRDIAQQNGFTGRDADEKAREYFNNAVADGQRRRIYLKTELDDGWAERQKIEQGWAKIRLDEDQFNRQLLAQYGNGLDSNPALGANTSLATDAPLKYITNRQINMETYEALNNAESKKESDAYSKLLQSDKNIADKYKEAYRTYLDDQSSKQDKQQALKYILSVNAKKDPNFVAWRNAYKPIAKSAQQKWIENNTIGGLSNNVTQSEEKTYQNSLKLFRNNYMVDYDAGLSEDLDKNLPYRLPSEDSKDQRPYAFAGKNAVFQPISMLEIVQAGKENRWYRYGDKDHPAYVRKISSAINGKKFFEDTDNIKREWGSGIIKGMRRNVANETVIFEDADVINKLNKIPNDVLSGLGISKILENGATKGYKIPITHIIDPNAGWASVDNVTHRRQAGASEAAKTRPLDQARQFLAQINP